MKKPEGLSLFTQQAQILAFLSKWECINNCRTVADCNGACRKVGLMIVFLLLFCFTGYSQTVTVKLDNGDYATQKVIFNSELEVVTHFKLQPTSFTYYDVNKNAYKIYDLKGIMYYIKETKGGFKKFKLKIN